VGYTIAAFITRQPAAADLAEALGTARIPLEQGLELVPVRRPRRGENGKPTVPSSLGSALWWLTADAEDAALRAAAHGPVAYAEAEYFGGVGEQRAVLWQDGRARLFESELPGAINTALKALDAERVPASTGRAQDEFDSVGLGRYRSTEDWAASTGSS
jgi:hypothetical protein